MLFIIKNPFTGDIFKYDTFNYGITEVKDDLRKKLGLSDGHPINIFSAGRDKNGKITKETYTDSDDLYDMSKKIRDREIRYFLFNYKTAEHGKQEIDLVPKSGNPNERVVAGLKRYVNSQGGEATIGDLQTVGCKITIPGGSLNESQTISVQRVELPKSDLPF